MRRITTVALLAAAALFIPVVTAAAGPGSTVIVVSRSGLPTPLMELHGGSSCGTAPAGGTSHVVGPATPPLGTGSLAIAVPAHSYSGVVENFPTGTDVGDLTSLSLATYQQPAITTSNTPLGLGLTLMTSPDANDFYFYVQLGLFPAATAAWQTADIFGSGVTITWTKYKQIPGSSTEISHDTQPWTTFAANNPDEVLANLTIAALPSCALPATTFDLDDLVIGIDDTTTTYDFEPLLKTAIDAHQLATSLAAGHKFRPNATLKVAGKPVSGQALALFAEPATASHYHQVATAITNSHGVATAKPPRPVVNTRYRWQYAATSDNAAAVSRPATLHVASSVSLRVTKRKVATTVANGTRIHATGRVSPKHKGTVITLWRRSGKHPVKLAHGTEARSGSFSIDKVLPRGTYTLFVTTAKDAVNAAGTSVTHKVTIT
jgi:hypothetical protein